MASNSDFMIKCKTEDGSFIVRCLNSESTVQELKDHVSTVIKLNSIDSIRILCGYPPRALADGQDSFKLKDVNIHSGETIIIEKVKLEASSSEVKNSPKGPAPRGNRAGASSDAPKGNRAGASSDAPRGNRAGASSDAPRGNRAGASSDAPRGDRAGASSDAPRCNRGAASCDAPRCNRGAASSDTPRCNRGAASCDAPKGNRAAAVNVVNPACVTAPALDELSGGIMMRHVVPANNSCLFASVYFVLSNGDLNPEKSAELRKVIAQVVASNKERYNHAFLSMSNNDYCTWIQDHNHWGGAIELAVLSEHFGIEIVAVDTITLNMHRFGENSNYSNRIFLIYDGIHYDPLVVELDNSVQTVFPVTDDRPMEMALEIAREARSSRQYTDVANFTLRCIECDERLCGDKEARAHAMSSGHTEFGEITK